MTVIYPYTFTIYHIVRIECEIRAVVEVNFTLSQCRITAESHIAIASACIHIDVILNIIAFHLLLKKGLHTARIFHIEFLETDDVRILVPQKIEYGIRARLDVLTHFPVRRDEASDVV